MDNQTATRFQILQHTKIEFKLILIGSTHTARRSFSTNEYLAGTPTLTIMAITGHKTEKAFLRYIKLVPSDHARLLKEHWEKRKLSNPATSEV